MASAIKMVHILNNLTQLKKKIKINICYLNKGTCECFVGFDGFDCSLSLSDAPQLSNTSYSQNVFDLSNGTLKDAVLFVIKFAADNPSAVLKIKLLVILS